MNITCRYVTEYHKTGIWQQSIAYSAVNS